MPQEGTESNSNKLENIRVSSAWNARRKENARRVPCGTTERYPSVIWRGQSGKGRSATVERIRSLAYALCLPGGATRRVWTKRRKVRGGSRKGLSRNVKGRIEGTARLQEVVSKERGGEYSQDERDSRGDTCDEVIEEVHEASAQLGIPPMQAGAQKKKKRWGVGFRGSASGDGCR